MDLCYRHVRGVKGSVKSCLQLALLHINSLYSAPGHGDPAVAPTEGHIHEYLGYGDLQLLAGRDESPVLGPGRGDGVGWRVLPVCLVTGVGQHVSVVVPRPLTDGPHWGHHLH